RRLVDPGEVADATGILLAVCQEPVQQTALIHDLDAARKQAQRADQLARLRILLQHQHVHVVEPELARQHHPGRTAPADDHLRHGYHPAAERGSCGKPPDGLYPGTGKENSLLAFLMCAGQGYADGEAGAELSELAELAELDELDAGAD